MHKKTVETGGIAGERPDNQHSGAGVEPHQGRQRGPHRVQVLGGRRYISRFSTFYLLLEPSHCNGIASLRLNSRTQTDMEEKPPPIWNNTNTTLPSGTINVKLAKGKMGVH